jgi:PLP dependent protein
MTDQTTLATPAMRLAAIRARIDVAAREASRDPDRVTLIAVSKTFDAPDIQPIIDLGQRVFGENRVQEAQKKWPDLKALTPGIELHLIGPLQSNKVREAVALFDVIHTVDRPKIAGALAAEMQAQGKRLQLFIQVNTGEEPQKAGIAPTETKAFIAHCCEDLKLVIAGLMCIPPAEEMAAVHFAFLAQLARDNGLTALSMGMSSDYDTAINLGATHVRVGSALFGVRA